MTGATSHWAAPEASAVTMGPSAAWNGLAFNPHQLWAFRRAELSCFAQAPFFDDQGERMTLASIRTLPPQSQGFDRLAPIARRLLGELTPSLSRLPRGARVAFACCTAERVAGPLEALLSECLRPLEIEWTFRMETRGHASLAFALAEVGPALLARQFDAAVVGGLDTAYDAAVVERAPAGVVLGEGGAFCALALPEVARRAGWERLAQLEGAAVANEPAPRGSDMPTLGLGRTWAMNALAEQVRRSSRTVDWWIADLTPERCRNDEWLLAFPRASADVSDGSSRLDLLPTFLGDLGAATLPTGLVLAAEGLRRGDPDARTCLICAGSDGPERGAVLVSRLGA